ncbi:MAG: four helix bundle protein [Deltaproteobacteria bacterium HGW-Deltaproteobacteria-15]|jgi:four helix bundle protein|nr:MAG: four helix bundle protein [Deltaproteobacteria bacterium HGW-Deltaproteobacteria-15]
MAEETKCFENLEAWKIARELTNRIYGLTREEPMARDFGFIDQIRRASVSVMNNLAEGHERGSSKEFVKFLFIARGSAGEVRSMLYVALDQGYMLRENFEDIRDLAIRCSQLCWGLIKYHLKNADWKTRIVTLALIFSSVLGFALTRYR